MHHLNMNVDSLIDCRSEKWCFAQCSEKFNFNPIKFQLKIPENFASIDCHFMASRYDAVEIPPEYMLVYREHVIP